MNIIQFFGNDRGNWMQFLVLCNWMQFLVLCSSDGVIRRFATCLPVVDCFDETTLCSTMRRGLS